MAHREPPLVVHVIHRLDVGGLENGLVNLVNRMPVDRYRHAIVCLSGFSEQFRTRIRRPDARILSLDKRPGKDLGAYWRMWRVLRRLRPDIVHTRNLGTVDMQWIAAIAGVRHRVHGEHGWEAADPHGLSPRSLRIRRACRPVIHNYVAMSQDIARWLERDVSVPARRIRQLYSGVDTDRFRPQGSVPQDFPWQRMNAQDVSGAGSSPVVLGTVGRLDAVKRQQALLEAMRVLCDGNPGLGERLRLVIAGDGPLRSDLESHARELGMADQVWFAGIREDTPDIMRSIDIFVLPSMNEGISNTILEAMAAGRPVVAARVGGNPELVVSGSTGSLYDPADPAGLANAIRPYVTDPTLRDVHGAAGRARVVQNFGLDAMVNRYVSLYDELMTQR